MAEEKEKIFAKGFYANKKSMVGKDGNWSFSKISIHVDSFIEFLQAYKNESGYVNFNLKDKQNATADTKNNQYAELDTWKPTEKTEQPTTATETKIADNSDDLPF